VRPTAINEQQVHEYLSHLFGEDLHAKRVLSLTLATLGVIHAASLSVYAIGQALAVARGTKAKHGVKQVDRMLSNDGIDLWHLFLLWVPYVLAQRTEAVVSLDWTDFDADDHTTLVATLKTRHGRSPPWSGSRSRSQPSRACAMRWRMLSWCACENASRPR
jgi:hypothetical protein